MYPLLTGYISAHLPLTVLFARFDRDVGRQLGDPHEGNLLRARPQILCVTTNYCSQGRLSRYLHLCSKSHRLGDLCVCASASIHVNVTRLTPVFIERSNKSVLCKYGRAQAKRNQDPHTVQCMPSSHGSDNVCTV